MTIEEIWDQIKGSPAFAQAMHAMAEKLHDEHPTMVVGGSIIANFIPADESGTETRDGPPLSVCVTKGVGNFIISPVFAGAVITNLEPTIITNDFYTEEPVVFEGAEFDAERLRNGQADS